MIQDAPRFGLRRAVVDDDEFTIIRRVLRKTENSFGQVLTVVEAGRNDRHNWQRNVQLRRAEPLET